MSAATLLVPGLAGAADWVFDPRVAVSALYDDNYGLAETSGEEVEVTGAEIDAQAAIENRGQRSLFRVVPRVRSTFFPDESDQESTDGFLDIQATRRGERLEAGLTASYAREDLLRGYLPSTVIDTPLGHPSPGDNVGQLSTSVTQEMFIISPNLEYAFSERKHLTFGLEYLNAQYQDGEKVGYTDYQNLFGSLGFAFETSERSTLELSAFGSTYDPDLDTSVSSDSYGANIQWTHKVSETSQFYLRGGVQQTSFDTSDNGTNDATSFSGGAGVRWSFQVTDVFVDANSGVDPNPTGSVVQRDQLRFRIVRRLSPVVAVTGGVRAIQDRQLDERNDTPDQRYLNGLLGLEWRMTRTFALQGSYEYTKRDYQDTPFDASSNSFRLTVVYEPRRPEGGPPITIY